MSSRTRALLPLSAGLLALFLLGAAAFAGDPGRFRPTRSVPVQILAFNDFHGNLLPPGGTVTTDEGAPVPAGGIEYLATLVDRLRAGNPRNTAVVTAGDLIGASPLLSALFHDEPTIEAMNELGLDVSAVGNHEFDEGKRELLRMQRGGCHPLDGCQDGDEFRGADFRFLAANVFLGKVDDGDAVPAGRVRRPHTLFPPYEIESYEGERVAFIGMTLEGTPTIVTPSGVAGLEFEDEADTLNALVPELKRRGAETIVVLLHEGGLPTGQRINGCDGISGPIIEIVERTDEEIDLFITGHTHQPYNCVIGGRPVTSADDSGRLVTDVDLKINRWTGEPDEISVNNKVVMRDVPTAAAQTALIDEYSALAAPIANRVIGRVAADITRGTTATGESALGDVIADAQLEATRQPGLGNADIAFMNPGGLRADLAYAAADGSDAGEGDANVTYEEAFTVQPFGNSLVTMTLTGAQIERVLEQQWLGQPAANILQVSEGFSYAWDPAAPVGDRVEAESMTLGGAPIQPEVSYRVTVNSFLADGGDNFTVLRDGTERLGGAQDLDALEDYFAGHSPVAPGARDRILNP